MDWWANKYISASGQRRRVGIYKTVENEIYQGENPENWKNLENNSNSE